MIYCCCHKLAINVIVNVVNIVCRCVVLGLYLDNCFEYILVNGVNVRGI